jgi:alpha-D-ribose 1-methylphosphonate 5-phosphate C-P lyase
MIQTETALRRTPLRAVHVKAWAGTAPFGGREMPVEYGGTDKKG